MADAEALPFTDATFDAVVSTFGVMFTPNQKKAADERMRACRPGGRIGMANWTPAGFIGQVFKMLGRHLPPPAGLASPAQWDARVDRRDVRIQPATSRSHRALSRSATDRPSISWSSSARRRAGAQGVPGARRAGKVGLSRDLLALIGELNTARDGSMRVPSAYAQIVITKA